MMLNLQNSPKTTLLPTSTTGPSKELKYEQIEFLKATDIRNSHFLYTYRPPLFGTDIKCFYDVEFTNLGKSNTEISGNIIVEEGTL